MADQAIQAAKAASAPDGTGTFLSSAAPPPAPFDWRHLLGVLQLDPWLEDHREVLKHRFSLVEKWANDINATEGGLDKFSKVALNPKLPLIASASFTFRVTPYWFDGILCIDLILLQGYELFGLNIQSNGDILYREWAPNAKEASLVGDFSTCGADQPRTWTALLRLADNWDINSNPMTKNSFGVWEVTVPAKAGAPAIPHESKVKASHFFQFICNWPG